MKTKPQTTGVTDASARAIPLRQHPEIRACYHFIAGGV